MNMQLQNLDVYRCLRGMLNLEIKGVPRNDLIEEAIVLIQNDGKNVLMKGYLGIKNYASFGDQRCDCEYGMGPRHGSIVFSIGRTVKAREGVLLGKDELYLLEAAREFGQVQLAHSELFRRERYSWEGNTETITLTEILSRLQDLNKWVNAYQKVLEGVKFGFEGDYDKIEA